MSTGVILGSSTVLLASCAALAIARAHSWVRLGCQATALGVLSLLLAPLLGSPLAPSFVLRFGFTRVLEQLLAVGWWLLAARVAVGLARGAMALGSSSREARILTDLAAGAIQGAAVLAVIAFVFALPVRGLLATSGVVAIVLGLALQNTLGDLFSGIAVGAERPYAPGDVLSVDGVTGKVSEVNWRSTHLKVGQPYPSVSCVALSGDGTSFALQFAAASSDAVRAARSEMLVRAHRHFRFAGMHLAIPGQVTAGSAGPIVPPGIDVLLAHSALFGAMAEPYRALLGRRFELVELAVGDLLFGEGNRPEALFVVAAGVVDMVTRPVDQPATRYRLSLGEAIGAVALITGSPQRATARAVTIATAFCLGEDGLAACLADASELAVDLERTVNRAMQAMARRVAGRVRGTAPGVRAAAAVGRTDALKPGFTRLIRLGW